MTDLNTPITDDELHAYVDGELPADRQGAVLEWLAANPEAAAQVAGWRAQAEAIRARYGAVASEPVPPRFKIETLSRRGRSWTAIAAAAAVAAFMVGSVSGWVARGASAANPNGLELLTSDALDAYKLYVVEVRHPVEVPGDERAHMTQWLSKRLGADLKIPELQDIGLKLVGGRLLPGATGAAAFYMYETASGERFTIYCAKAGEPDSALHYKGAEGTAAFYFVDKDIAYVVSGPANRDRLEKVTQEIYAQVEKAGQRKS
ncbi:MAG: anti-sigma factor [Pseudolabrys sp.]|nr:anti-sigma factor [Pseudolabrys sp.]